MTTSATKTELEKIISRIFVKDDGTLIITEAWEELLQFIDEEE